MSKGSQERFLDKIELPEKINEEILKVAEKMKLSEAQVEKLREAVKKVYLMSRFEPGEAMGIITAQSISEPSTQMSLGYEEKILIKSDEKIEPIEIGRFVDGLIKKFGYVKQNGSEILDLPKNVNFYVYSLDHDEKLKLKRIKSVIRHKSPKKLLRIKTASGRRVIATDHHSFVLRLDNKVIPVSGKQLKIGDRIPVMKLLPENCLSEIKISSLLPSKSLVKIGGDVYPYVVHSKSLPDTLKLDSLFGWLIGAYLSEGNCTKNFVNISNTNEDFNLNLRKFAKYFQLTINEYDNLRGFSKGHDLRINSSLLSNFLKITCGANSENKKVPSFAFSAKEEFVSAILQAYFDGDGNITLDRRSIRASSKSEELIDGIALLLTRFGIFCSKSNDRHQLYISYKYASRFLEKIGTSLNERKMLLKELSEKYKNLRKVREYTDMVPGIGNLLFVISKKLKFPTRYVNNFTKRQRIGRETLRKYLDKFGQIAEKKKIDISMEINILKQALDSDVVWDKIEEISHIEYNGEYVYDVSVDDLETFVTFDGIVTHNTMRTYHIAGTAGIKVTYGLPRLIEIFDAKKTPENPEMTIYLKRKYDSEETARRVAEEIIEKAVASVIKTVSLNLDKGYVEIEPLDRGVAKKIIAVAKGKLKNVDIRKKGGNIIILPKTKVDIRALEKLKETVLSLSINPIKGIKNAIVRREERRLVIITMGSNLKEVLKIREVDPTKTITTNIHEVVEVLGIEAARELIIREVMKTLNEQGLEVDMRHIALVADIMTFSGKIRPIGRYGIAGTKTSVLARAAFEETIKHLVKASVKNEVERFRGIFENVLIGHVVPAGTGMFELIAKIGEESE
ncbi:MAG: DNA-directed RNA polymerase subunit A'' [Candidatus Aenigmarchaeota archaeon]|nr:DNA-directed RNA polymerase subunit A'' [Candidatus Aenigmarchaeota archaeon]